MQSLLQLATVLTRHEQKAITGGTFRWCYFSCSLNGIQQRKLLVGNTDCPFAYTYCSGAYPGSVATGCRCWD
jgi:hypothetical protein